MESWKETAPPRTRRRGYYVGLMNACGYRTRTWKKPVIGIVNSFTDAVNPGHRAFRSWWATSRRACGRPAVRQRVQRSRPCDGMAQGEGMHFILPSRDLIAGSIQAMASAHGFDGLVFLCSCDKIVPGMLMAAAALNKPVCSSGGRYAAHEADEGTYITPDLKGIHRSAQHRRHQRGDLHPLP